MDDRSGRGNHPPSPKGYGEAGLLYVRIEATAPENGQECRAMVVDITDRKRMEERWLQLSLIHI